MARMQRVKAACSGRPHFVRGEARENNGDHELETRSDSSVERLGEHIGRIILTLPQTCWHS